MHHTALCVAVHKVKHTGADGVLGVDHVQAQQRAFDRASRQGADNVMLSG